MKFNEVQFFDTLDQLDARNTAQLLFDFKKRFKTFDRDSYDFIKNMNTRDALLLLMISIRFMDFLNWEV